MKTKKTLQQGWILTIILGWIMFFSAVAQDAIVTVDYSKPQTSYYRPGTDHNIVHGVVTDYQKSIYRQNSPRIIRDFISVKSFYADETKNVLKSKTELDQQFASNNYNYMRICDISQSLLLTMKVTPSWMGQDATFNYSGLESAMKSILTYLKQTFPKFEYLECWNEPDLFIATEPGLPNGAETPENYTLIYACYEKAVKYVNATVNNGAKLKIGGPITSSYKAEWVNTLLKYVKANNLQCDFIGWHSYQNFGGNPGKEVGYCKASMNAVGVQAKTLISEFGNFAGGHQADGTAAEKAKQAASVMDQSYGFVMAGGDVLMTWVAEHIANELKSIFPYDAAESNQQIGWQTYDFNDVSGKYFYLQFHTTAASVNTVVKEIQLLDVNGNPVAITKIRGSSYMVDNNESTTWTSASDGIYMGTGDHIYSTSAVTKISKIRVCWGGTGKYRFDLFHSSNSADWSHTLGKDYVNPVGHLLFMESKLGDKMVARTSTNVAVNALTTISDTSLSMIVYSRSDVSSFKTTVNISNIPAAFLKGKLVVRRYLTDETHSNFSHNRAKAGLEMVCDSIVSSTGNLSLSFTQVKNSVSLIEIVPAGFIGTLYKLTVNSGSGTGYYSSGKIVTMSAGTPVIGKMFDKWTGSTSGIANINSATTTIIIPSSDIAVTATYKDAPKYTLTVTGGTGSGLYFAGETISITANSAAIGQEFKEWTGATTAIASPSSASTSLIMPVGNTSISSSYQNIIIKTFILTVNNGTGSGIYNEGSKVNISATVPAGKKFYKWIGATSSVSNANTANAVFTIGSGNAVLTATFTTIPLDEENNETALSCYPNPSISDISIKNCSDYSSLRIFNLTGTLFQTMMINQRNDITLSVESFSPGLYFIELIKNDGESKRLSFIKE